MPSKINKDQIDLLLKELAKAYRGKYGKNARVELIIVGGGSIMINYGFRDQTDDLDILSSVAGFMKSPGSSLTGSHRQILLM